MSLQLTPDEVTALSGGYVQPARQLQALHELGFWRARISPLTGKVIVERAHYEAVAAGAMPPEAQRRGAHFAGPPKLRLA